MIYAIVTASVNVNTPNLTPNVSIIIPFFFEIKRI